MTNHQFDEGRRSPAVVRISGTTQLLGLIASVLGFHPAESIVLVTFRGAKRRLGPVVRIDLPAAISVDVVEQLAAIAEEHADEVIVVLYSDLDIHLDATSLVDRLDVSSSVLDVIRTNNVPAEIPEQLAAAEALAGRGIVGRRDDLVRSIAYNPAVDSALAAGILGRLDSIAERDELIAALVPDAVAALPELIIAAQATDDSDHRVADLCAVLAVVAYRAGNGALAQVAIDRTLASRANHRLAHLMLEVMAAGLRPADLDHLVVA